MIEYTNATDRWIVLQVIGLQGSVLPKAAAYALANAVVAAVLHWALREYGHVLSSDSDGDGQLDLFSSMNGVPIIWSGYTGVLGFLVVFRNNQAYARFWEGASLVRMVRGEWFNATSQLIAFSSVKFQDPVMSQKASEFKELLICLMSALYCSALRQICELDEEALPILDLSGISPESLKTLEEVDNRCQIIVNWLQRLTVQAMDDKVIQVSPPVLSRVFQEMSRGMVHLSNLRKIALVPFPYPYQQMLIVMLIFHNIMTTCMAAVICESQAWATVLVFMVVGCFWGVIYIAVEVDQPFGDDENDLPLIDMQKEFNKNLITLLTVSYEDMPCIVANRIPVRLHGKRISKVARELEEAACHIESEEDALQAGSPDPEQVYIVPVPDVEEEKLHVEVELTDMHSMPRQGVEEEQFQMEVAELNPVVDNHAIGMAAQFTSTHDAVSYAVERVACLLRQAADVVEERELDTLQTRQLHSLRQLGRNAYPHQSQLSLLCSHFPRHFSDSTVTRTSRLTIGDNFPGTSSNFSAAFRQAERRLSKGGQAERWQEIQTANSEATHARSTAGQLQAEGEKPLEYLAHVRV